MLPPRGALPLLPAPRQIHAGDLGSILHEHEGDVGVVLWKAARAVDLWAQTPEEARRSLFAPTGPSRWNEAFAAAAPPPPIAALVRDLFRALERRKGQSEEGMSSLCLRIAEWAEGEGALATAIAFAEAAALACSRVCHPALAAGQLLKRRGAYARAESWLQRCLSLAISAGDLSVAARAWSELGSVFALRGNLRGAEAAHLRALRLAMRHHLRHHVGVALHDLCGVCIRSGDAVRTQKYARRAIRAYYSGHPRLPAFASDLAYFWALHGEFECALQVFLAVLPHMPSRREQLFVAANLIRAAGGAGRRDIFEAHWEDTLEGIRTCPSAHGQAAALLDLARGAAGLGEWDRAERAAAEALAMAAGLGEGQTLIEGDAVLESIRRHRSRPVRAGSLDAVPLPQCASLAAELEAVLLEGATER